MAVLNDLLVKGKTRLIGDVNAGNIKAGTLNISGTATADALVGKTISAVTSISAPTISASSGISAPSIVASTSFTEAGVLLSNKYAEKTHVHGLSNVYCDNLSVTQTVDNGARIVVCGTSTGVSNLKQPASLAFTSTNAGQFVRNDGQWGDGLTAVCFVNSNITAASAQSTQQTVLQGSPYIGALIIGLNGGIGRITACSLYSAHIYNMEWTFYGLLPLSGTDACTVSNTITGSTTTASRTVTNGRPVIGGFVIGTDGGIGLLTSVTLSQGTATYNLSWNYCGQIPLPAISGPLLRSSANTSPSSTFTGSYYKIGKLVTITGYFSGSSGALTWTNFLPYTPNTDYKFAVNFFSSSNVMVTGMIHLSNGSMNIVTSGYATGASANGTYVSDSTASWASYLSNSAKAYITFSYFTDS